MFSITADFDLKEVEAYIQSETDAWLNELIEVLRERGKEFVRRSRSKVNKNRKVFNNITWNLVSSMGYCLVYQNKIIESYFPSAKAGTTGEATGAKYAKGVVYDTAHSKNDVLLVLVAGEHYAEFVDVKGFDVIGSSSIEFEDYLKKLWQ